MLVTDLSMHASAVRPCGLFVEGEPESIRRVCCRQMHEPVRYHPCCGDREIPDRPPSDRDRGRSAGLFENRVGIPSM